VAIAVPHLKPIVAPPRWAKDGLWRKAQLVPSLDLNFAATKNLVDATTGAELVTFTRTSDGTATNSSGNLIVVPANMPRFDHDPVTGESLGLLVEGQRVNLLLNSETLVTQTVTVTAAAHTLSFYGTGSVVLSGAHSATVNGTGAYPTRTTLTFTPTAGSLTLTVTGTVQYANLEAGAFATSWIPTTDAAATRAADVCSISGSNLTSWFDATQGSIYANWITQASNNFANVYQFNAGTATTNLIEAYRNNSDTSISVRIRESTGTQRTLAYAAQQWTGRNNIVAHAYQADDMQAAINGLINTSPITAMTLPSPNALELGNANGRSPGNCLNGHLRRFAFWPSRLSDNVLQALTQ
jgi:hypothetical protein